MIIDQHIEPKVLMNWFYMHKLSMELPIPF